MGMMKLMMLMLMIVVTMIMIVIEDGISDCTIRIMIIVMDDNSGVDNNQ